MFSERGILFSGKIVQEDVLLASGFGGLLFISETF